MSHNIIRIERTSEKTNIPASSIYEMVRDGRFPKPVKLSARRSGWVENEVDDWLAARIAERDTAAK